MNKAFEYEWKGHDRKGRPVERRLSVGAVSITTFATVLLTLTGHGMMSGLMSLLKALKWW